MGRLIKAGETAQNSGQRRGALVNMETGARIRSQVKPVSAGSFTPGQWNGGKTFKDPLETARNLKQGNLDLEVKPVWEQWVNTKPKAESWRKLTEPGKDDNSVWGQVVRDTFAETVRHPGPGNTEHMRQNYSKLRDDQLEVLKNRAAVDLDTDTVSLISNEQKTRRAVRGKPTLGDRLSDLLSGSLNHYTGSIVSTTGGLLDALMHYDMAISRYRGEAILERNRASHYREMIDRGTMDDGTAIDEEKRIWLEREADRAEALARIADETDQKLHAPISSKVEALQDLSDRLYETGEAQIQQAKKGMGTFGRIAVDAGEIGLGRGFDTAIAAPFSVKGNVVPFAFRSFGDGIHDARQNGADFGQQMTYGIANTALNLGTSKLLSVLANQFGTEDTLKIMEQLSQTPKGRILLAAIGGGSEEMVRNIVKSLWKQETFAPNDTFSGEDAENSFATGAMAGAEDSFAKEIIPFLVEMWNTK